MEAWRVGRWVTYANLPGWQGNWSLLLPPDWKKYANKRLEDVAAFQWKSANQYIIDDLSKIPDAKVVTVSYTELVNDTYNQIKRICNECDITFDERLETLTKGILPHSKYTQTAPAQDKWKKNRNEIDRIQPGLNGIIKKISKALLRNRGQQIDWCTSGAVERVSRNSQCPCGSGRKYKQCHGRQ
jgi:hypothetical protein